MTPGVAATTHEWSGDVQLGPARPHGSRKSPSRSTAPGWGFATFRNICSILQWLLGPAYAGTTTTTRKTSPGVAATIQEQSGTASRGPAGPHGSPKPPGPGHGTRMGFRNISQHSGPYSPGNIFWQILVNRISKTYPKLTPGSFTGGPTLRFSRILNFREAMHLEGISQHFATSPPLRPAPEARKSIPVQNSS